MKKYLLIGALVMGIGSTAAVAHHPTADIVDEEIYEMIDSMVADTPHADLTFDSMGDGSMTDITVSSRSLVTLENLIDDGLLTYAAMLDGTVTIDIQFSQNGSVDLVIQQTE
jgi:hypothetical protein